MRKGLLAAGLAAALTLAWMPLHGNIPGKAELETPDGTITIDYVAPALKGRDIGVDIKQPGANPWRMGADRATTMTTPVALQFGDGTLSAGSYTLRAYLDDEGQWWLQAYDSSRAVVGKLPLAKSRADNSEEHLVIDLSGDAEAAKIKIQWGQHRLDGGFSVGE